MMVDSLRKPLSRKLDEGNESGQQLRVSRGLAFAHGIAIAQIQSVPRGLDLGLRIWLGQINSYVCRKSLVGRQLSFLAMALFGAPGKGVCVLCEFLWRFGDSLCMKRIYEGIVPWLLTMFL